MKKVILTESDLHRIVRESVERIINEIYVSDNSLNAMEKAFSTNYLKGSEILKNGAKEIRGKINPNAEYEEEFGSYLGSLMPGDVVVEYPNGTKHTLSLKRGYKF